MLTVITTCFMIRNEINLKLIIFIHRIMCDIEYRFYPGSPTAYRWNFWIANTRGTIRNVRYWEVLFGEVSLYNLTAPFPLRFCFPIFSVPKGNRQLRQRPEMAHRHGRGQKNWLVQAERRVGQRQFLTSENRIPRVDQRYL